ncbi:magnesium transporter MgtE N-terminal domain-containing protein [uncultured Paludibaculum sp.]|uniref:magnesium transporter MgtE N-terminal domain-containing protein n=1 Tax=uncultured Paludibaculum sp. TaxID=1765020 RepID=UPI002AAAD7E9|nr:CBS domain-containing protein [uncultured Paludibaculum sp.]
MAERLLYLTELLGLKVYDLKRRVLGRVRDAALVPVVHPIRIERILLSGGGGYTWVSVRYDQVESITLDGIFLSDEHLIPYHEDEYVLRLVRDLLDQQIIDAQGRKVVRVTDITFDIRREAQRDVLHVLEVDIGIRSVFRRLVQGVLPRRAVRQLQHYIPVNSIRWELCNILEPDPQRRLRLNIDLTLLEEMHPADLADIVEDLSPEDREAIFEAIDTETAADALSEMEPDIQAQIIESLETEKAADILEEMDPDEAADVLAELERETSEEILEEMEGEPKADVEELLEYDEDTAGGMMNTAFVAIHEDATVSDALDALRHNQELADTLNTLFLTDLDERLKAALPVARVFLARPTRKLSELVQDDVIKVPVGEKSDRVVELFDKYNLLTLPVVDEEGRMAGVVTADDIISVLRQR